MLKNVVEINMDAIGDCGRLNELHVRHPRKECLDLLDGIEHVPDICFITLHTVVRLQQALLPGSIC